MYRMSKYLPHLQAGKVSFHHRNGGYNLFLANDNTFPIFGIACYTADLNGVKGLSGYKYQSSSLTSQTCRAACKGQGFALSGTYAGDRMSLLLYRQAQLLILYLAIECFCGNTWAGGNILPEIMCSSKCAGG